MQNKCRISDDRVLRCPVIQEPFQPKSDTLIVARVQNNGPTRDPPTVDARYDRGAKLFL